ncbi:MULTISPECIES: tail fiber assembly protein [Enterobacteriaceae]|uniref:tail fiber assembly protein n=1 Tax=Enterobacteriaceae TaxID=543 RepID=UPI0015D83BC4|nr:MULTISPECIES: tail fiber assembly protein [Enterobacteriaceae]MCU6243836.1 tail fiber assembly protein [Enterobacter asburiae]
MTFKMKEETQTITIYNLRADTLEFIGAGDAYIPAHTGLPAYSTDIEPPSTPTGKVAVFNNTDSTWSLVEDHRDKTVFDTETGNAVFISELGPLPANTTSLAPDGQYMKWDGSKWVKDDEAEKAANIADAQNTQASLMQEANNTIAPLQDAADLDMATDDDTQSLTAWKRYRVLLSRINPDDAPDIDWPEKPE